MKIHNGDSHKDAVIVGRVCGEERGIEVDVSDPYAFVRTDEFRSEDQAVECGGRRDWNVLEDARERRESLFRIAC
jgi:hypothetical protein